MQRLISRIILFCSTAFALLDGIISSKLSVKVFSVGNGHLVILQASDSTVISRNLSAQLQFSPCPCCPGPASGSACIRGLSLDSFFEIILANIKPPKYDHLNIFPHRKIMLKTMLKTLLLLRRFTFQKTMLKTLLLSRRFTFFMVICNKRNEIPIFQSQVYKNFSNWDMDCLIASISF